MGAVYADEAREIHKAGIRRLLAVNPQMSLRDLSANLKKNGMDVSMQYIHKMRAKVQRELVERMNRTTVNQALNAFVEVLNETSQRMWMILSDPHATHKDKIAAARVINDAHDRVFDKMFEAGVFTRDMGTLTVAHTGSVDMIAVSEKTANRYEDTLKRIAEVLNEHGSTKESALPPSGQRV
jgi:hypothetical protein